MRLESEGEGLCRIEFGGEPARGATRRDPFFVDAVRQLEEYFSRERREFSVRLAPRGTPFQLEVWRRLLEIPYGTTISYRELAVRVGNPSATRAVGAANGRNPLPIIIPCHRVIGADGSLTGYGGGLRIKERLLELEGASTTRGPRAQATLRF